MLFLFIGIGVAVVALAHMAPFPFLLDALHASRVTWRMPHRDGPPTVYLTYDDGPNPAATPALLDVLAEEQVQATFFLIERHITEETAPIVRRISDEGHSIGLHSHTRREMVRRPEDLARQAHHVRRARAGPDRASVVPGVPAARRAGAARRCSRACGGSTIR